MEVPLRDSDVNVMARYGTECSQIVVDGGVGFVASVLGSDHIRHHSSHHMASSGCAISQIGLLTTATTTTHTTPHHFGHHPPSPSPLAPAATATAAAAATTTTTNNDYDKSRTRVPTFCIQLSSRAVKTAAI